MADRREEGLLVDRLDPSAAGPDRAAWVRRGQLLAWATVGWNLLEGVVAITAGVAAGSIALVGFGADSFVEVVSGATVLWRLSEDGRGRERSARAEARAVRIIAVTFGLLATGVVVESLRTLAVGARPDPSPPGLILAVVSLIVMPLLARAKHRVGRRLDSRAVAADATETVLCVWLSAILVVGLGLNALVGWWWADPVAALGVAYVAGREAVEHWRAETPGACC